MITQTTDGSLNQSNPSREGIPLIYSSGVIAISYQLQEDVMAQKAAKVTHMQAEWMAREPDGWRVRVPTEGGHKFFKMSEYGSSTKCYEAARKFQVEMYKQHQKDLEYKRKNGELPPRKTIYMTNRSGIRGVSRQVFPNLESSPRISYVVTWTEDWHGRRVAAARSFNSNDYVNEAACKKEAIAFREEMVRKHKVRT